jgi:predicted dehydrogenase
LEELAVIVVGLGPRGRQWLDIVGRCEGVRVVGGVDPDPGARYAAARYLPGPEWRLFTTLPIALNNVEAAGAIVCTPPGLHAESTVACLEAGMGVLLEKPFAPDAADAREMIAAAASADLPLIIAQNYRHALPHAAVRRVLADGLIGDVGFCQLIHHGFTRNPRHPRAHMPYAQLDMAVHHFDALRDAFGCDCVSVMANSANPPWSVFDHGSVTQATLRFANGVHATYCGSWASQANRFSLRIEGADGFLTCEDTTVRYRTRGKALTQKPPPVGLHRLDRLKAPLGGMHALLQEFRAALGGDRGTPNRAEANLQTLGIVLACMVSDRERREVAVEEALGT